MEVRHSLTPDSFLKTFQTRQKTFQTQQKTFHTRQTIHIKGKKDEICILNEKQVPFGFEPPRRLMGRSRYY